MLCAVRLHRKQSCKALLLKFHSAKISSIKTGRFAFLDASSANILSPNSPSKTERLASFGVLGAKVSSKTGCFASAENDTFVFLDINFNIGVL